MKIKKSSTIDELQKVMKKDMDSDEHVSKKKIRQTMEQFMDDG